MWAYQTTPDGMPSKGTSIVGMQERNPGLDNNTGGLLSVRPSAPPKPTNSVSGLHVRKTATYANPPQSSIVLTRKASPRATRHMKQRVRKTSSLQGSMLDATGTRRVPVEHYINLIRDSVHRIGVAAMPLIDQLCFSSRRAQIDGLFRLCPSIDITDAGKIVAYLQSNASEIEHLRTLTRGHSVIPVDHLKSPNSEIKLTSQVAVDKKATMRNGTALPGGGGAPGVVQNGNNRGNNAMRVRQAQAHARTHAPVFKFGKDATVPTVTDVQMIFSDLEKMKNQFVGLGEFHNFWLFFNLPPMCLLFLNLHLLNCVAHLPIWCYSSLCLKDAILHDPSTSIANHPGAWFQRIRRCTLVMTAKDSRQ